jgi:hypothetical protein
MARWAVRWVKVRREVKVNADWYEIRGKAE